MGQLERITRRTVRHDTRQVARDRALVEDNLWRKLRGRVGQVSWVEDVLTAYYCALDPRTPFEVKATLMGALAYFVIPARGIPRVLGWVSGLNSTSVLTAALRKVNDHVEPHHRDKARQAMAQLRGEEDGEGGGSNSA